MLFSTKLLSKWTKIFTHSAAISVGGAHPTPGCQVLQITPDRPWQVMPAASYEVPK